MTLTNLERQAIQGILDSDYMDGETAWPGVGKDVWSWSANPFTTRKQNGVMTANSRTFSGVISSLVKKGYVKANNSGTEEASLRLTEEGFKAFQS